MCAQDCLVTCNAQVGDDAPSVSEGLIDASCRLKRGWYNSWSSGQILHGWSLTTNSELALTTDHPMSCVSRCPRSRFTALPLHACQRTITASASAVCCIQPLLQMAQACMQLVFFEHAALHATHDKPAMLHPLHIVTQAMHACMNQRAGLT